MIVRVIDQLVESRPRGSMDGEGGKETFAKDNERLEGAPGLNDGRSATQTLSQNERKGGVPAVVPVCLTAETM
jgi:hypothetical protein